MKEKVPKYHKRGKDKIKRKAKAKKLKYKP